MAGFGGGGFGAGGGGFGQPPQQQQPQPSFGGFGQPQQQQPAPGAFGAAPQHQQQQPAAPAFGNPATPAPGFGSAAGGFGTPAAASAGGGFGSGGFGASNTTATAIPSFGTPPPAPPAAGGGFGSGGGGFGQAAPPPASAFGQSQTTMATPATGFGATSATPAAAPSSGFGGGFGGAGAGGGGFGHNTAATTPTNAQQQQQQPSGGGFGASSSSSAVPNPFGGGAGGAAPAPAMSFGTSATVAQPPPVAVAVAVPAPPAGGGGGGFGSGGFGAGGGTSTSGFGSTTSSASTEAAGNLSGTNAPAPAFGASTTTGGFGQQGGGGGGGGGTITDGFGGGMTSSSAFGSGGFGGVNSSSSPAPFGGGGGAGALGASVIDGGDGVMGADNGSIPFGAIPRKKRQEGSGTSVFGGAAAGGGGADDADTGGGDELSRLKAKLEAKKKKFEEQKRQRAERQHEQEEKSNEASASSSAPFASSKSSRRGKNPSPVPPRRGDGRGFGGGGGGSSSSGGQIDKVAMAAKNAARFATKTDRSTRSLLPPDLRKKVQAAEEGQEQQEPEEGEIAEGSGVDDTMGGKGALHKAKSLEGICMVMCPDEELLRREKEGDIQMLETPDPGGIHPAGWTLRNTAVKRFRRSAADFKLDIPELVRPSVILERCCAYLEEWVMERDRQGPDSRYGDAVPPSLDVYQFIWDRTRMIRKDYILQNYTGTGGRCSAAAVRCHERIARWHCMMEHQLSHIADYVVQQSQQNIQELGQAMKTLNLYYDDSEGRSTMEEKDCDPRHGCQSDIVMGGRDPVDYDGSALNNDNSSMGTSSRIIGQSGHASNGTAEPEMRGLYIILTLNNDGGMEVLKYASSLYKNRPEIYNSRPVQLALSVFRAWKENNYVRFFAILRDPDTPYLFACVMFKYVMDMRKSAMKTMSRSYGGKSREGKNHYDKYPLTRLRDLLCYESTDEAREACRHYNIAVVTGDDGGRFGGEWIEWRKTSFREKTDPKKGHIIPLRPLKMNKTIESKRRNATRVAVCRGEVSGEGSTLSHVVRQPGAMSSQERMAALQEQQRRLAAEAEQRAKDASRLQQRKEAAEKLEAKRQRKAADAAAKAEELARKRQEEEEKERQRHLALQRAEAERKEKLRRELEKKKRREEEARKKEAEKIQREKEAAARAEAERKRAKEAARLAAIERKREEERLRLEAEERERQRQLELKRIEEERRAAEARRRAEEEAARAAEAARLAEEERLRKIREEEERREREWQRKLDAARKEMAFRRWRRRAEEENRGVRQTHQTLERLREVQLDLSQSVLHSISRRTERKPSSAALVRRTRTAPEPTRPEDLFYRLGNMLGKEIDLSTLVADALAGEVSSQQHQRQQQQQSANTSVQHPQSHHHVSLFKMAVIVPSFDGPSTNLYQKLYKWMYSRFAFGVTTSALRSVDGKPIEIEVRSCVVQIRDKASNLAGCDSAIVVIPPYDVLRRDECVSFLSSQAQALSQCSVRCVCLNLDDGADAGYSQMIHNLLEGGALGSLLIGNVAPASWTVDSLDSSLFACCAAVRTEFVQSQVVGGEPFGIGRISLPMLGRLCLRNVLWDSEYLIVEESVRATEHGILRLLNEAITCLIQELNDTVAQLRGTMLSYWPCRDFASSNKHPLAVAKYWDDESVLPLNWLSGPHASEFSSPLDATNIYKVLMEHFQVYRTADTVGAVAKKMLAEASIDIKELCKELVWDTKYRQALEEILLWEDASSPPISLTPAEELVYLPRCEISGVVERTIKRVSDLYTQSTNEEIVPALTAETALAVSFPTSHRVVDAEWKAAIWKPPTASSSVSSSRRSKRRAQRDADENTNEASSSALQRAKRRRPTKKGKSKKKEKSQEVYQSKQFSARLEDLLNGEATVDMNIGGIALSEILGKGTPGIELPK